MQINTYMTTVQCIRTRKEQSDGENLLERPNDEQTQVDLKSTYCGLSITTPL